MWLRWAQILRVSKVQAESGTTEWIRFLKVERGGRIISIICQCRKLFTLTCVGLKKKGSGIHTLEMSKIYRQEATLLNSKDKQKLCTVCVESTAWKLPKVGSPANQAFFLRPDVERGTHSHVCWSWRVENLFDFGKALRNLFLFCCKDAKYWFLSFVSVKLCKDYEV